MEEKKRFVTVYRNRERFAEEIAVIMDMETGVQYLYKSCGYGGGLTVLLDRDGKPLLGPISDRKE